MKKQISFWLLTELLLWLPLSFLRKDNKLRNFMNESIIIYSNWMTVKYTQIFFKAESKLTSPNVCHGIFKDICCGKIAQFKKNFSCPISTIEKHQQD